MSTGRKTKPSFLRMNCGKTNVSKGLAKPRLKKYIYTYR